MSSDKSVAKIVCRFNTEVLEVQRYIGFIRAKSSVHLRHVFDINKILQQFSIPELPMREALGINQYLTVGEIQNLIPAINDAKPLIDRQMSELNRQVDLNLPFEDGSQLDQTMLGEWIAYLMNRMPAGSCAADIQALRIAAIQDAEREGDQEMAPQDRERYIDVAIRYALHYHLHNRLGVLQDTLDRFDELDVIAKATSESGVTDPLRHAFIVLMAAFDATVFDLVRLALRKNFFALAPAFGNKDKYSIAEISNAGSFDAFRDEVIEEQLTRRYVKGVLFLLSDEWKVECVDKRSGDKFERLIEIILRRNVHLHNRGIVDEFYLNEKKNLDQLKVGDQARIEERYWDLAKRYCTFCVRQIAIWVESVAV